MNGAEVRQGAAADTRRSSNAAAVRASPRLAAMTAKPGQITRKLTIIAERYAAALRP